MASTGSRVGRRGDALQRLAWRAAVPCAVVAVALASSTAADQSAPAASAYFGAASPGSAPALFAPGIVSTGLFERDLAVTPDGREIYWTVTAPGRLFVATVGSRRVDGEWTKPDVVEQMRDPTQMNIEPAISPDGRRFFFTRAVRGPGGSIAKAAIWVMEREGEGWAAPHDVGAPINAEGSRQFFPSVTRDGTLYFTRETGGPLDGIYRSRRVGGAFAEPVRLPAEVNTGSGRYNACVDPLERFVIVPVEGRAENRGAVDYYVVFRNDDDSWSEPLNLGDEVNTPDSNGYSPSISPDGRCFFFMSSRVPAPARPRALTGAFIRELAGRPQNGNADIYWMDAAFILRLRPKPPSR